MFQITFEVDYNYREVFRKNDFAISKVVIKEVLKSDLNSEHTIRNSMNLSILGDIPKDLNKGDVYVVSGELEKDNYGFKLKVGFITKDILSMTGDEKTSFLRQIYTEKQVDNMLAKLECPVNSLYNKDIESLLTVYGVTEKNVNKFIDKFYNNYDLSYIYAYFGKYDISTAIINRMVRSLDNADKIIEMFEENPYFMADEVSGIGFKRADEIALKNGVEPDSRNRIMSYIQYLLNDNAIKNGHTYIKTSDIGFKVRGFLVESGVGVTIELRDKYKDCMKTLIKESKIVLSQNNKAVSLSYIYNSEMSIAEDIVRINNTDSVCELDESKIAMVEDKQGYKFTNEQLNAIMSIKDNNVILLTGGAGCGKTATTLGILHSINNLSIFQCALSGRAAQRISEVTGYQSSTIHRLLGFTGDGFTYDRNNKLPMGAYVIDEASMIDTVLFKKLLEAIPSGSKIIIIGDTGQLEAIGYGCVLRDLIKSEVVSHTELTKIHRQASKSAIITNSYKIRKGERICSNSFEGDKLYGDLEDFHLSCVKKNDIFDSVISSFKNDFRKSTDIFNVQILTPMKDRGSNCTYVYNNEIQEIYNPNNDNNKEEVEVKSKNPYVIRVGDKVILRRNTPKLLNLDTDDENTLVCNGSMGIVKEFRYNISGKISEMIIDFKGIGNILFPISKKSDIHLGYAISIHLSQGSQYDYTIVSIDSSAYIMLTRELLYTAVTRAKNNLRLICENRALQTCIKTTKIKDKKTLLKRLIEQQNEEPTLKKDKCEDNE